MTQQFELAIQMKKSEQSTVERNFTQTRFELKDAFLANAEEPILLFAVPASETFSLSDDDFLDTVGQLLQGKVNRGQILSFFIAPVQQEANPVIRTIRARVTANFAYDEEIEIDVYANDTEEDTQAELRYMACITVEEVCDQYGGLAPTITILPDTDQEEERIQDAINELAGLDHQCFGEGVLDTAREGVALLDNLKASLAYPYPHVELPSAPALLFPIKNTTTEGIIWVEVAPSGSALTLIIHKEKPAINDASQFSHATAMAGVHLDYHVEPEESAHPCEILQVLLHDAKRGPYDEAHWDIPELADDYQDAGILLVSDVQAWKPCEDDQEEEERSTPNA